MVLLIIFKQSGKPQICLDASTKDKPHQYSLCRMLSYKKGLAEQKQCGLKEAGRAQCACAAHGQDLEGELLSKSKTVFVQYPNLINLRGGGVGGERLVYLPRQS